MREMRPVEVVHVGRALREHRENLGVTLDQMVMVAGGEHQDQFAKIEKSQALDVWFLEQHHGAVILAWERTSPRANLSVAVREQWYTTPADWQLWDRVKQERPATVWWWGAPSHIVPAGAYCYACDSLIHSYNTSRGMTKPARAAVMLHRYGHMVTLASLAANKTKETVL